MFSPEPDWRDDYISPTYVVQEEEDDSDIACVVAGAVAAVMAVLTAAVFRGKI